MYNVTMRRVPVTTVTAEKQLYITYSECVFVTLVIQYAVRMRRIIIVTSSDPDILFHIIS